MFLTKLEKQVEKSSNEKLSDKSVDKHTNKITDKKEKKVRKETILNQQDYEPRRFNLKYNPPVIVLEYETPSNGKKYIHNIKLKKLKPNSDLEEIIEQIYEKHHLYLDSQKVKISQVISIY